ncbi:MAG: hypothetical protein HKN85_04570 [Gammaproteobacteria bacterium]|nr:hypothetical protein [Gammaproteobacteria bacterium]
MKRLLLWCLILLVAWKIVTREQAVSYGPGIMASAIPKQTEPDSTSRLMYDGYQITPLADFHVIAKVLSKRKYRLGREADLSPIDLTLGWGRMSDESVLAKLSISQSNRWYRWQAQELPIPRREIETHSANMHLIPADSSVERALNRIRKGELIELHGQLVSVSSDDGWQWTSSLTRNDTGAHACELILVESVIPRGSR